MLFAIENLPYWIFLGSGMSLFLLVILSGGGDADGDADIEVDGELDVASALASSLEVSREGDLDGGEMDGSEGGISPWGILGWLGFGKAPLLLLIALDLCLWGLIGWMTNVFLAGVLGQLLSGLLSGLVLAGSMVVALFLGGQIARPIGNVFAAFGESASADRLVGCEGTVSSAQIHNVSTGKIAQVDVIDPAKNMVTINAVLPLWGQVSPKIGEQVLVIERSEEGKFYFVVARKSVDESRWFSSVRGS
ncbi:MAG: DUF1449 domain-containing protein [Cyanobacteria bacterium P01_A01_bin.105]